MKNYAPKVVFIEFNPIIPNDIHFVQERNFKIKQGSSAKAIVNMARKKGYPLVCTTTCNAILVKEDLKQVDIKKM